MIVVKWPSAPVHSMFGLSCHLRYAPYNCCPVWNKTATKLLLT